MSFYQGKVLWECYDLAYSYGYPVFRFQVLTDTGISLLHILHIPTMILQAAITAHSHVKLLLLQEKNTKTCAL